MTVAALTLAEAARMMREAVKNKGYRAFPLGQEAGHYLRAKGKRLTKSSYRDYESCLDKLARHFVDLELVDLEPPVGTERVEEFLDEFWGHQAPRTYNKNLSILSDFFKWARLRGKMVGDPTLAIERAKARGVYRTTFTADQRLAILDANRDARDQLALRLLLDYGIRKGALRIAQFEHFDHQRRKLTIFTKGEKVLTVPIPQPDFWLELERLILEVGARSTDYLVPSRRTHPIKFDPRTSKAIDWSVMLFPERPLSDHGLHDWWYRCLAAADVVPPGTTSGERMHKARHTAGQVVLDKTKGNLKAVQKLLGHASLQTTADTYLDWDDEQLAETMADVLERKE